MARKRQASGAARPSTARSTRSGKAQLSTFTRSSSPLPMLRPGTVELPEPPESGVPLAAVAHSMQMDARRKFAATYEDITQYMDKCEYLFDHDEFYDKSYKSLARTVTELNRIATDAQQQEREQLYSGLIDWFSGSSFTLEAPTHGAINEHQLIESGQITRDVLSKMLLGLERLRALHITITDKARSAAERAMKQADKSQTKRQLLKTVDQSSFVWKTAAAEIVQLLHDERSKGGELVEVYADKIRYLMGELEAQSNMIEELRVQLDQQHTTLPVKFHGAEMKTKQTKHEVASRQAKVAAGGQQQTASDGVDEDDIWTTDALSTLPDFNKQLLTTLQKELDECRRQHASVVAKGHEAAAKIRFLTEESNRKDKQIAQLQANIAKLKSETRDVMEPESQRDDASTRQLSDDRQQKQTGTESSGKRRQRGREMDNVQDTEDDESATNRMKLTHVIAAAKRQKRPSHVSSAFTSSQAAQSTDAVTVGESRTASAKPGKVTRGLRAGRGKMDAVGRVATAAAASGKHEQIPDVPSFEQMGIFWQQSAIKEWTPVGTSDDSADATKDVKATATRQTPVQDVDMNEAIEMTKLFLAGSKTQQQQQTTTTTVKARGRESIRQQRKPIATAADIATISPQLFTESSASKAPTTVTFRQQQRPDKPSSQPIMTSSAHPAETSESVSSRQHRAKTPAEAAKQRAARLSVVLFHSDGRHSDKSAVQSTLGASKPNLPQQQQNVATMKSKQRAKAGNDLVGVNMHHLAQHAKMLENTSLPKAAQRFN